MVVGKFKRFLIGGEGGRTGEGIRFSQLINFKVFSSFGSGDNKTGVGQGLNGRRGIVKKRRGSGRRLRGRSGSLLTVRALSDELLQGLFF